MSYQYKKIFTQSKKKKQTSETGFLFFFIGTWCWHNSHWFFTDFLNHVRRQVAWTNWADPIHLHGAMRISSPPVWHILQMTWSSDPSVVSFDSMIGNNSAIWVCCILRIKLHILSLEIERGSSSNMAIS